MDLITLSAAQFRAFLFSKGFFSPLLLSVSLSLKPHEVADSAQPSLMLSNTRMANLENFNFSKAFHCYRGLLQQL